MKSPTKKELLETIKAFDRAATTLHTKMFIVQPFLSIYKKHGKSILWAVDK